MSGLNGVLESNSDCLLYNDYGTGSSRRVIKHILRDVWWSEKKGINVIAMGTTEANSVEVIMSQRKEYKTPQEWANLTIDEALSQRFYTLQRGDRMVHGIPDAPSTFTSTVAVDQFFGTEYSHQVMSVDSKRTPGRKVFLFKVGCQ